jgi:hypothetical protein
MKYFITAMLIVIWLSAVYSQVPTTPAAIRQEMARIRKATNWDDPAAVKIANEKIRELSRQLMMTGQDHPEIPDDLDSTDAVDALGTATEKKLELWEELLQIEEADEVWDLARILRNEIVEEYQEDEDPTVKNQEWLSISPDLLINLSDPMVEQIIGQMPLYSAVKTLIITSEHPVGTGLIPEILNNAKDYPLEKLYIIHFSSMLTSLPSEIARFSQLKTLCVHNNHLDSLPKAIGQLTQLKVLQLQGNPMSTLLPVVQSLTLLEELWIEEVPLPEKEVLSLQQTLPNCKIIRQ